VSSKTKKDFTKGVNAVDRFFKRPVEPVDENVIDVDELTEEQPLRRYQSQQSKYQDNYVNTNAADMEAVASTKAKNKSKHFDTRGPRNVRMGVLVDAQLKSDLVSLAHINRVSINDLVVTVLLEYVESDVVRMKLKQFETI